MEEIRIKSWADLQDRLYDRSWYQPHGRFRAPFAFRGVANRSFPPRTSLSRLGGRFSTLEDPLLRNFRKYAVASEVPRDSTWNWLAVAQHHGLPTRLLDWTYSPNVALHFATENFDDFGVDGMILAIDFIACRNHLPAELKAILDREGALLFTAEMLNQYAKTLAEFDANVAREGDHCVAFFEPPSLDERIVNQAALFSFVSSATVQIDEWLARQDPGLARRLIIPASLKWEIRDKLDMANVTERVIYPGIDGLSRWLQRYYSPNHKMEIDGVIWEIQEMHDGRIIVEREGARMEITSREDGGWWDMTNGRRIAVRPRPRQYE